MSLNKKAAPKFKVGDEFEVISGEFVGFKFLVTGIKDEGFRILYLYSDLEYGQDAAWTEDNVNLSTICKSPLWRALE